MDGDAWKIAKKIKNTSCLSVIRWFKGAPVILYSYCEFRSQRKILDLMTCNIDKGSEAASLLYISNYSKACTVVMGAIVTEARNQYQFHPPDQDRHPFLQIEYVIWLINCY
eukprot:scaffold1650_cov252-Chaetoceros_neogracile.AAC.5